MQQDSETLTATPPVQSRWSDELLDKLRNSGDTLADACVAELFASSGTEEESRAQTIARLFREMDSNDSVAPADLFPELSSFVTATRNLPDGVDLDRIDRGQDVFGENMFPAALALLAKSLPEGYAAPNLSTILTISDQLQRHPYRRLLGTLQTVLNVCTCNGFQHGGRAVITAQKLRLLHAGVRTLVERYRPGYTERYGVPVNHEDMLATIIAFSYLVIDGLRKLDCGLTREQEEDLLYVWRVFAVMMGIHPEGKPHSFEYIPESFDDAALFYDAYKRRHYVDASTNPDGVALAQANLRMLQDMIPRKLRSKGLGFLPRIYMTDLIDNDVCRQIGIRPVIGHDFYRLILYLLLKLLFKVDNKISTDHNRFGNALFRDLIKSEYGSEVCYLIPRSVEDLRELR